MSDFTFLTDEQIFGDKKLDILKKYGTGAAITDFSILLGGYVARDYHTSEGILKKDRTGWWWSKNSYDNDACAVYSTGCKICINVNSRNGGARPALSYSSICDICSNKVRGRNEILEVEYGEYPQTIVSEVFAKELEVLYSYGIIKQTGKSYTTDSVRYQDKDTPFQARTHIEYEYNGKKYIRFVGDSNCSGEILSDGRTIQNGDIYWVEVEPIKWMIDEKADIALSKKILFSGVQFKRENDYDGDFFKTTIKQFMDEFFSKDIIPSKVDEKETLKDTEKNYDEDKGSSLTIKINGSKILDLFVDGDSVLELVGNGLNFEVKDKKIIVRKEKVKKR